MPYSFYSIHHQSKKSKARVGEIHTAHGVIKTPAFVPVATKGTIKALSPQFVKEIGIQTAFVNTYHLVNHPGVDIIKESGGIHNFSKLNIPLMSDSGGFQVFSLAKNNKAWHRVFLSTSPLEGGSPKSLTQKQVSALSNLIRKADVRGEEDPLLVKISDDGVKFRSIYDGQLVEFTPEKSIEYQMKIGADIMMAFDECTYYPATEKYAQKAIERTHEWLKRCIKYKARYPVPHSRLRQDFGGQASGSPYPPRTRGGRHPKPACRTGRSFETGIFAFSDTHNQNYRRRYLYGIIQGATFEDLRKKSAKFVVSQPTDGIAIGGVAVGETKKEMRNQVRWVSNYLPKNRPVHLLGVGQVDDILDLVKYGVDTFDCVEPTRLGRMGTIYQISNARRHVFSSTSPPKGGFPKSLTQKQASSLSEKIDVGRSIYKNNLEAVDTNCNCYVCQNFTKAYLHHLFKQKEILGYMLATYHNLYVMELFFAKIRELIINDQI